MPPRVRFPSFDTTPQAVPDLERRRAMMDEMIEVMREDAHIETDNLAILATAPSIIAQANGMPVYPISAPLSFRSRGTPIPEIHATIGQVPMLIPGRTEGTLTLNNVEVPSIAAIRQIFGGSDPITVGDITSALGRDLYTPAQRDAIRAAQDSDDALTFSYLDAVHPMDDVRGHTNEAAVLDDLSTWPFQNHLPFMVSEVRGTIRVTPSAVDVVARNMSAAATDIIARSINAAAGRPALAAAMAPMIARRIGNPVSQRVTVPEIDLAVNPAIRTEPMTRMNAIMDWDNTLAPAQDDLVHLGPIRELPTLQGIPVTFDEVRARRFGEPVLTVDGRQPPVRHVDFPMFEIVDNPTIQIDDIARSQTRISNWMIFDEIVQKRYGKLEAGSWARVKIPARDEYLWQVVSIMDDTWMSARVWSDLREELIGNAISLRIEKFRLADPPPKSLFRRLIDEDLF